MQPESAQSAAEEKQSVSLLERRGRRSFQHVQPLGLGTWAAIAAIFMATNGKGTVQSDCAAEAKVGAGLFDGEVLCTPTMRLRSGRVLTSCPSGRQGSSSLMPLREAADSSDDEDGTFLSSNVHDAPRAQRRGIPSSSHHPPAKRLQVAHSKKPRPSKEDLLQPLPMVRSGMTDFLGDMAITTG